jgi:hypothetical protein
MYTVQIQLNPGFENPRISVGLIIANELKIGSVEYKYEAKKFSPYLDPC